MTAPLRDAGHDVEIVDYEFLTRAGRFRLDDETWLTDVCGPLLERAPQLIGITVLADTLPVGLLIGRYLRRADPGVVIADGRARRIRGVPRPTARVRRRRRLRLHERRRIGVDGLADAFAAGDAHPRIPGFWSLDPAGGSSPTAVSWRTSTTCRCPRMTPYP